MLEIFNQYWVISVLLMPFVLSTREMDDTVGMEEPDVSAFIKMQSFTL